MGDKQRDARSQLPLAQSALNILMALAEEGEGHGYAIKRAVERRTDGRVRIGAGTLYEALQRLLDRGMIYESDQLPDDEMASSRWRCYGISDFGREVLQAELERLDEIVRYARSRRIMAEGSAE